uniref:Uncharacterized protein n=1 Tax=Panagrellus redivivus TaxID=6233 RepID=A0A7E4VVV3_PANRE
MPANLAEVTEFTATCSCFDCRSSDEDEVDDTSNHAPPTTAPPVVQNGTSREAPVPKPAALPANMVSQNDFSGHQQSGGFTKSAKCRNYTTKSVFSKAV